MENEYTTYNEIPSLAQPIIKSYKEEITTCLSNVNMYDCMIVQEGDY